MHRGARDVLKPAENQRRRLLLREIRRRCHEKITVGFSVESGVFDGGSAFGQAGIYGRFETYPFYCGKSSDGQCVLLKRDVRDGLEVRFGTMHAVPSGRRGLQLPVGIRSGGLGDVRVRIGHGEQRFKMR